MRRGASSFVLHPRRKCTADPFRGYRKRSSVREMFLLLLRQRDVLDVK